MLTVRSAPSPARAPVAQVEVRAPVMERPSMLQPLTKVRTLLRLMQLNVLARQSAGKSSCDPRRPDALPLRLADLIRGLSPADQFPVLKELARADWADPALIAALCSLPIEVSASLILHSPVLDATALCRLIDEGDDKGVLIARRAGLDTAVIDRLIEQPDPAIRLALLNNAGIALPTTALDRLIGLARDQIALRAALVRHPALSHRQACTLLGFIGPRLRDQLTARFDDLYALDFTASVPLDEGQTLHRLQQGDFAGFSAGLARSTGLDEPLVRQALRDVSGVPFALCLVVAGIDRATFSTLLSQLQAVNDGRPQVTPARLPWLKSIFDLSHDEARARLTAILAVPA